jgi:hypothetical protein
MSDRDSLPLLLFVAAIVLVAWTVRSPAAVPEAAPAAHAVPHCSLAFATRNGVAVAKRGDRATSRTQCASALRPRAA